MFLRLDANSCLYVLYMYISAYMQCVCVCVCVCVCLCVCVCVSVHVWCANVYVCTEIPPSHNLSLLLSIDPSICLIVHLCVCHSFDF